MVKRGGRAKYKAVNLPQEILDEIDDYIKNNPVYRSRAEFVKYCIFKQLKK